MASVWFIGLYLFRNEHIWLLDFRYYGYDKHKEESINVGDIDLSLYGNKLGLNNVVIVEFKRADAVLMTDKDHGENKPAILSSVGRALSQTIHYIENKKAAYRNIEGIVIIGRRRDAKDWLIDTFNNYLHGIKVVTFDELYVNAARVINTFKAHATSLEKTS